MTQIDPSGLLAVVSLTFIFIADTVDRIRVQPKRTVASLFCLILFLGLVLAPTVGLLTVWVGIVFAGTFSLIVLEGDGVS